MRLYDLCLAWNWEHDADFVRILDSACAARGLTLLEVSASNLNVFLPLLSRREAGFRALLDRASEADSSYLPLVEIAKSLGARRFNPRELADRAYDKAAMHRAFLAEALQTPRTVILPAYEDHPDLPILDLAALGQSVTVKPAEGGGGEGVITDISTLEQIQSARRQFPQQQYLLQEHVTPKIVEGLPAWFRVIYCLDEVFICVWDTNTHIYTPINNLSGHAEGGHTGPPQRPAPQPAGTVRYDSLPLRNSPLAASLREVTRRIARLCRLDLFSTEIAAIEDNRLLVVDYVNDPIDLRLQSRVADGVPDNIVQSVAERIVSAMIEPATRGS